MRKKKKERRKKRKMSFGFKVAFISLDDNFGLEVASPRFLCRLTALIILL
jgi:hypothetical protein